MANKVFDHIFIIMFENETQTAVLNNPFMTGLAGKGVRLSNYFGVTHPSQPNYIASVTGSPCGVSSDKCYDIDSSNIVDLLEDKGITWKAYMEDLPEDDKTVYIYDNLYYRKHNPFISLNNIRNNPDRLANIVNAQQLQTDVKNQALPQYCWYTPNIQNDGHTPPSDFETNISTRNVDFISEWLQGFLPPLLENPNFMEGTLVVLTFDESIPHGDNNIYTVLLGNMVKGSTVDEAHYNHYSLLRTVEENFELRTLGRGDQSANWFRFLWGEEPKAFNWAEHSQLAPEGVKNFHTVCIKSSCQ